MDRGWSPARPRRSLLATALLAACSHLPPPHLPPHADFDVEVRCVVPADGRLPMPSSTPDTVVFALRADPPPSMEDFSAADRRWFLYPPGTTVTIACRGRRYGSEAGVGSVADLFPRGAQVVDVGPAQVPR